MLSPTRDREAKWNTASHGPAARVSSNSRRIGQVGRDQAHAVRHRSAVALAQAVQHDDLRALLD